MRSLSVRFLNLSWVGLFLLAICAAACQPAAAATQPLTVLPTAAEGLAAAAPTLAAASTPTTPPTTEPSPTSRPPSLWEADYLPQKLKDNLALPQGFDRTSTEAEAGLRLDVVAADEIQNLGIVPWVYALVAPFPTVCDEASLADLKSVWSAGAVPGLPVSRLLVDESTKAVFEKLWGPAASLVQVLPAEEILDAAWSQAQTWAVLPFENLEPRWKVLTIDGQSPLRKDFQLARYGLTVYFGLSGDPELAKEVQASLPQGNRLAEHLTTVMLTGVTALVRGTASFMEGQGMTYPARDIGAWLQEADILHISNEVPFAENCPQPFNWEGLAFCSQTEYIQLLEYVGADVIELTGDHFADWGPQAMLYTLKLYKERGWKYYGGGANATEAAQPALFEHNGNRIAFLGCNAKEPGYATASATTPGAIHCDFEQMTKTIQKLVKDGYLPIVTFQHLEYYSYPAHPILKEDFEKVAKAGAIIVSGSQAHQPHAFEFYSGSMLHYGLGNLFFDQTNQGEPPRTAFIDRHIFYEGKYISTELLSIYFVNYALSRPMTLTERQALLGTVFKASGWDLDNPAK